MTASPLLFATTESALATLKKLPKLKVFIHIAYIKYLTERTIPNRGNKIKKNSSSSLKLKKKMSSNNNTEKKSKEKKKEKKQKNRLDWLIK